MIMKYETQVSQRISWIDNLKSFAIFLLFWGHCCGCFDFGNLFIVAWHMPLFVFASGYTSLGLKNKIQSWQDVHQYILKLSLRLAVPCILYVFSSMAVGYATQGRGGRFLIVILLGSSSLLFSFLLYKNKINGIKRTILLYCIIPPCLLFTPIWYLPFMIEVLITFAVIQCVVYKYLGNSWVAFVSLYYVAMMIIPSPFHATAEFVVIFLIAMLLSYKENELKSIYKRVGKPRLIISMFIIMALGFWAFISYESLNHQFYLSWWYSLLKDGDYTTYLLRQVTIICFVPSISFFVILFTRRYNWFSRYGSLTLGLYPLNCIYVVLFGKIFNAYEIYNTDHSQWWIVILYMITVLFASIITVELFNRYRFTRFAFLGVK